MAHLNEKLAASLAVLEDLQQEGRRVFQTAEFSRYHRERLHHHGFLLPVMKGWWMTASPEALPGDTTPWYSSFWEFCALYCTNRFGSEWHLSPEQSLLIASSGGPHRSGRVEVVCSKPCPYQGFAQLLRASPGGGPGGPR